MRFLVARHALNKPYSNGNVWVSIGKLNSVLVKQNRIGAIYQIEKVDVKQKKGERS